MFFRDIHPKFNPKIVKNGPKMDQKWTENWIFLENLRMREIKGLKIIMRIGLSHVKI